MLRAVRSSVRKHLRAELSERFMTSKTAIPSRVMGHFLYHTLETFKVGRRPPETRTERQTLVNSFEATEEEQLDGYGRWRALPLAIRNCFVQDLLAQPESLKMLLQEKTAEQFRTIAET